METARASGDPADTLTDSVLISGLALHDEGALVSLIESCGEYIYGKALQILHEPSLAEEVTQDTLLVLWWHPERFDASRGTIKAFLIGVARFKAIDLGRREDVVRNKAERLRAAAAFPETLYIEDESDDVFAVRAALHHLPAPKREVIYLAFYEGLNYRQVAEELGLPEGTVKTRIRDSLIRLRAEMSKPRLA